VSRVKKLVPEVHKDNLRVFEEMDKCVIFGNMLVHNNPPAGNASLEEVRGFVNAVRELEALFTCAQCGRRVEYHRDAEIIKCRCSNGISWPTKG
jgi:hypothetical protein